MKRLFYTTGQLIAILLLILFCSNQAQAQPTTMAAGDLVFTSFSTRGSGAGTDSFAFVLLKAVNPTTVINFTDRGWNGSSWNVTAASETSISWTVGGAATLPVGTEVLIVGLSAYVGATTNGAVVSLNTPGVGLELRASDQVIAYQGTLGSGQT